VVCVFVVCVSVCDFAFLGMIQHLLSHTSTHPPLPHSLLQACGLPTALPAALSPASMLARMAVDKKTHNGWKHVVFVSAIGECGGRAEPVADTDMLAVISRRVAVVPRGCACVCMCVCVCVP
jgi:3-dehydroquinate synthetase